MSKRAKIFGCAALIAGLTMTLLWRSGQPSYRGRTLTSWLAQFADASLDQNERRAEAQKAICTIGPDNALPILFQLINAQDSRARAWIIQKNERWNIRFLKLRDAMSTQQLGISGFEALETNGAPAVAELTRMLDDTNHAFVAIRCLVYIGKPAEASVCQALTNRVSEVRSFSASQLAWVTDDIELFLSRLNVPLNDLDGTVRFAAMQALGLQTDYPDEVVPLLIRALDDPQESVCSHAFKFLGDFGTNGVKAFSALSNIAENETDTRAGRALRSLRAIAPERALPIILTKTHSTSPRLRSSAAYVLGQYDVATPEIVTALRRAAADSDAKVARSAKDAMTKLRQKKREKDGADVVVADEPSYEGRRLGEWLKMCQPASDIPAKAKSAIQQMGTNAIPALLERLVYRDAEFDLEDPDTNLGAAIGFTILGEQGKSAIPKLEELMNGDDERVALLALISAYNMGTSSMLVLTMALTNRSEEVRNQAVALFADEATRKFPEARKAAVPALVKLLADPSENLRMNVTNALKEIDSGIAAKAGVK